MSHEILRKIDLEYEEAYGKIVIPRNKYSSNTYINILEHRRWMHPLYGEYMRLAEKEALKAKNNKKE
jgi:hypothetical protein